jgi:hypothetical protein
MVVGCWQGLSLLRNIWKSEMLVVTDGEMRECLAQFPELRCEGTRVGFDHPQAKIITINLRLPEPHMLVSLARIAASLIFEEGDFRSAYFWVTQWGVWDANVEAVGFNGLERYRQGFGENRPLTTAPGHLFRHDEFLNSVSCLVQPMLVGWDAYYIPQFAYGHLEYFVFVSHDLFVDIRTRTDDTYRKVLEILKRFSWINTQGNGFEDHAG